MHFTVRSLAIAAALSASAAFSADTLSVWIMPNGASPQEKLEQQLAKFTEDTRIPVKVQVLDWGEAWNRISTTLETGENSPDLLQLGSTWVPYFAARGELKNLNEILEQVDSTRFVPVSWYTSHIDSDTNIYAIPWFIDVRPVLGNKRIMKKYGITPASIRSYKGFSDAIRKVNEGKELLEYGAKIRGYAFPGKSDWNIPHNFAPWIWSYGGKFVDKDKNGKWHASILTAPTLEGIAKYLSFILHREHRRNRDADAHPRFAGRAFGCPHRAGQRNSAPHPDGQGWQRELRRRLEPRHSRKKHERRSHTVTAFLDCRQ